ncbi:MAG: tRNA (adenine(22)-N(1))-methyltransferase [Desulfitobacteriaceae bacterium]
MMALFLPLGPRLSCVASYVSNGARLGDIGTDHAYLPIVLCEQGVIASAVAVDVHAGPYQSALSAVQSHGLETKISVRLGDGLSPLKLGEVDTLTIAGMGGNTMLDILGARPEVLLEVSELVLQPQGAEAKVRYTLLESGWFLKDEQLVEEDGRIYGVMVYSKSRGLNMSEIGLKTDEWLERLVNLDTIAGLEISPTEGSMRRERLGKSLVWQFGPLVLEKPNCLLKRWFDERIEELDYRLREMLKGKNSSIVDRMKETEAEKRLIEDMSHIIFPNKIQGKGERVWR